MKAGRGDHSSLLLWAPNQVHLALLCIYPWLPMSSREEKHRKEKVFSCSYVRKRSAEVRRCTTLLNLAIRCHNSSPSLLPIGWSPSPESSEAAWWNLNESVFRKHTLCSIRDLWLHSTSTWQGKPLHKQSCVNSPRSGIVDPQTDSLHGGCSTWI